MAKSWAKKYIVPLALTLILALILLTGCGSYFLLKKDAEKMAVAVQNIQDTMVAGKWEESNGYFEETLKIWDKIGKYWPMLIHHQEMTRIEESMNRLKSYLAHQDSSMSQAELFNLIFFIKQIPAAEVPSLKNIF